MPESWSTSSLDLLVDPGQTGIRRAGLERALRQAIRDGRLGPGARLPSTRALALDLGVARGTVSEAYAQLAAEGFLVARQGAGTTVARDLVPRPHVHTEEPAAERPRYSFFPGQPDLSGFPRARWADAVRRALQTMPDEAFGYGDPRGHPEVRAALATYLGRVRGVLAGADRIVVCTGFQQALGLLCTALRARGATAVALEDPTVPDYREIVRTAGLKVVPLSVDDGGVRVDALTAHHVDAIVVTPAHQCPMGSTLLPERRAALVRWAREHDALIVEDDYDGELRYDRAEPVGALQGLDPERVAYAGTASKSLAPGLRLAWLALPSWLLSSVTAAKHRADRHTSVLDQFALADLLTSGAFDRHVRQRRLDYRRRRDLLTATLTEALPWFRPVGLAAGLHVLVWLPPYGPSEAEVVARAAERSVELYPLGLYWHDPRGKPPGLVIGYAAPPRHLFPAALAALTAVLSDLT